VHWAIAQTRVSLVFGQKLGPDGYSLLHRATWRPGETAVDALVYLLNFLDVDTRAVRTNSVRVTRDAHVQSLPSPFAGDRADRRQSAARATNELWLVPVLAGFCSPSEEDEEEEEGRDPAVRFTWCYAPHGSGSAWPGPRFAQQND
jgi:hypothetical protein